MNTTIITQNAPLVADCEAFLNALYKDIPDDLLLEIRCIHPVTTKVRSLWIPINNGEQRINILKQASQLNREGYGIYFAPCLRREQKGTAEHTAVATSLWIDIDCEDDAEQREKALQKLENFEPKPSIILDSGGGWHGYWLLDEPYLLDSDEQKKHIALILQGLFAALDGDAGYVKSVASVMRLPDSINTKPDRGGVICAIKHFEPEPCYALADFEWLKVETKKSDYNPAITVNGQHPLPPRTEDYLASGANDGSRNSDLFAAACQLRDAQLSQSDAESQLVARYVADGVSGENAAGREKEARKTIASVYSQSARDPISSPRQIAQQKVGQLVEAFQPNVERETPDTQEIIEAVEACVSLNAVEWAVERKRLKAICSDGLKMTDLDRLYREKKREQEREQRAALVDTEVYLELDGYMVYRRHSHRGMNERVIANWTGCILERLSKLNDDGEREHFSVIEVQDERETVRLEVPSETFGDDIALRKFIAREAGESFTVRAGMSKHLASAILSMSGDYPVRKAYSFMGWIQQDDKWIYLTPRNCVTAKGKLAEPPLVELHDRLRDYGVSTCSWDEAREAFSAMSKVFPEQHTPACIAFALLPLLQRFFPSAAPKPALHLAGTYGSGKSELAALMCSFYGNFSRDAPPSQWGDTINTVEILGHPLSDALYWVDDFKTIYADERTFTRFLQSYSRGMGRGRLTREAKLRKEHPCRGLLLSTGETTLEGEASVLSRMLVLEVPSWEYRDPQGNNLAQADIQRDYLSGFAAHFASWIAKRHEDGDLQDEIAKRFASNVKGYEAKLTHLKIKPANTGRVVKNWSVLVTVYQLLSRFLRERDADDMLPAWQDTIAETIEIVREERASEVFLNVLGQLIASGEAVLAKDKQNPFDPPPSSTLVGYVDNEHIHLLPDVAYSLVTKYQNLKFTTSAIGTQLREDAYLLTYSNSRHLTTKIRIRGTLTRLWRLRSDTFNSLD